MNVLIVEDEQMIRDGESAYLKNLGYEILEAADGEEAVTVFQKNKVDLVILDINLPKLNGLEVCKFIRATSSVPIIMVTARTEDEDELKGFNLGINDYIKKPFNPLVLVARVKALLKDKEEPFIISDLHIDPSKMEVKRSNQIISLTAIQFEILLLLSRKPGQVFSRDQIMNSIYSKDDSLDVFDRSIDAHIKRLRKKLGDSIDDPKYIETIVGKGYKFITP